MKSYRFIVHGIVQGVYYRKFTSANALNNGFCGYVMNLPDGTVEACVTCADEKLKQFISILHEGSPNSKVDKIEQFDCEEVFSGQFQIKY